MTPPNILFIMADQFRADALGCVGGYARTPHLDKLAAGGCLFTNVYANSAECVPSRISLATGLYPHQTGIDRHMRCTLDPNLPNWMQTIAAAGYRTSLFGKTHLHPHEGDIRDRTTLMNRYGLQTVDETTGPRAAANVRSNMTELWEQRKVWEDYRADLRERYASSPHTVKPSVLPLELYYDCYVGGSARRYLENLDAGSPWFCWVSFGGPHEPWDAPEPYASMYSPGDMPLPRPKLRSPLRGLVKALYDSPKYAPDFTPRDIAAMRANYAGNVSLIDDEIGKILEAIRRRGEADRTIVVFTSDHGEMNGDYGLIYKSNFFDASIKLPLIVAPARGLARTATSEVLVELMDVGATVADYAGAQRPAVSAARSLRPVIEGQSSDHRTFLVSEFAGHSCLIGTGLKVEFDRDLNAVLAFDRMADPDEQTDISQAPEYQSAIDDLRRRFIAFRDSTPRVSATCN